MKTCDYCGRISSELIPFKARKTDSEFHICEDCLDGSLHDYFYNLIAKSKLIPLEVSA